MDLTNDNVSVDRSERELTAVRVFDAPREMVFRAWTEPERVAKWWGPRGFTNTILEMDVRPGGIWRLIMHGPDGRDYPNRIRYTEVVVPERLVYIHDGDDGDDSPAFHVTVVFAAEGEKTRLSMSMIFDKSEDLDHVIREFGADKGLIETLGRLEAYLDLD